ncbi:MAG: pseudaminic acid cytidylyltransferase [Rhodocyclaceae bacterium]|jgi:pseudaminic acid cytidylyltransferase|nr:pseudaminic acid cytidylyltransferase [Rhodocyclaceae bacterium]
MKIAIVPARGGSKRIPRKNVKLFAGLPMIAHSLRAATASGQFDRILVSSEDDEILAVGREHGGESLRRPPELADDHTATIPVIRHAIGWAEAQGWPLEAVCCIYATAPFVHADDLRTGWRLLQQPGMDFAFAATTFPYPVFRGLLREGKGVRMIFPEHFPTRSQDLPEALHDAGQFYWGTPRAWKEEERIFSERAAPVMLPRHRVQDIDTEEDWQRAELLWRLLAAEPS